MPMIKRSRLASFRWLVAKLQRQRCNIIRMRFGMDGQPIQTLVAIGDQVGVTRERVRQVEAKAQDVFKGICMF